MGYKMHQQRFRIAIGILACALVQIQGADTDEKRPYEFGFEVEVEGKKQQHRHEEKDKDGIIMGEFGFITADDVYHVTVYATDKDGRFKILSMKNIHLKSSSAAAQNSNARQGHSLGTPAIPATPTERISGLPPAPGTPSIASRFGIPSEMVTAQKNVLPQINTQSQFQAPITSLQPSNIRSCSSCSIPTTTPRAIPTNNFLQPNQSPYFPQGPTVSGNSIAIQKPSHNGSPESNSQLPEEPNQSYYPTQGFLSPGSGQPAVNIIPPSSVPSNVAQPGIYGKQYTNIPSSVQSSYPYGESNVREPKQFNGPKVSPTQERLPGLAKPKLVSVDMQIVDKNTDIDILQPGEKKGLPNGLNEEDISRLLYIFNYTVGFHGHYEEGYENGVKKGYYYVTGRNGVRTRIDYLADNTGFHPKVSQEILDLLSDDVPKPETEKDAKYGLKSYEFKWLYFPVGSERY